MVTLENLDLAFKVRILAGQPIPTQRLEAATMDNQDAVKVAES